MSEHEQGDDVFHVAIVEERERDDIQAMAYRVRCAVCETELDGGGPLPLRFVCDGCGAVNVVVLDSQSRRAPNETYRASQTETDDDGLDGEAEP